MRFFFRKFYISSMTFCRKKQKWRKYENVRCNLKWKHCTNNLSYVGLRHVSPCAVSPCAVKKPLWFHEKDSPSKPSLKSNRSKYLVFHTNENELTPRNYINTSIEKIVKWLHYPLWFDEKKKILSFNSRAAALSNLQRATAAAAHCSAVQCNWHWSTYGAK